MLKRCPFCAEEIQDAAVVCRHCQRDVPATAASPLKAHAAVIPEPPPQPKRVRPKLGLAAGFARKRAAMVIGTAILLMFLHEFTYQIGVIVGWVGVFMMLRGSLVPRFAISFVAAALMAGPASSLQAGRVERRRAMEIEQTQAAERAKLPQLDAQMRENLAAGNWDKALATSGLIRAINPSHESLKAAAAAIEVGIRRERAETALADAQKVVSDTTACETPKRIADVWTRLRDVKRNDPQFQQVTAVVPQLERCRIAAERELSKALGSFMVSQREAWADKYEKGLLGQGIDARVALLAPTKNQVRIRWVLLSRAAAYQITNGGSLESGSFLRNLQDIGFSRVIFDDGFNESWSYQLNPSDESTSGARALAELGIGKPLVMQ